MFEVWRRDRCLGVVIGVGHGMWRSPLSMEIGVGHRFPAFGFDLGGNGGGSGGLKTRLVAVW